MPRKDLLEKYQTYKHDQNAILRATGERYLWDKYQEEEAKKRAEDPMAAAQAIRAQEDQMMVDQSNQIDWQDFVVVEKIDLYDDEEMKMIEEAED